MKSEHPAAFKALVASIMNKEISILCDGVLTPCLLCGNLAAGGGLCVGDWIEAEDIGNGQCRALRVLPREASIYRGNRRSPGEDILIAANATLLLAVVSADYLRNQAGYLEAAILAAQRAGIEAGVFVSKWDLIDRRAQELLQPKLDLYRGTARFVFTGSAHDCQNGLLEAVRAQTVLVVGDRACGKTTLINRSLWQRPNGGAGPERAAGTHTASLRAGPDGTLWIDTPGFRDFALRHVTPAERVSVFPEIADLTKGCYFSNCTHVYEDACKVLDALRQKQIRRERYDAYQKMSDASPAAGGTPKVDHRHGAGLESFTCKVCGALVTPEGAGSRHRNHCPKCLSSLHLDEEPGDRASLCRGIMDPISIWVRKGGEWAIIHRCRLCGALSSNRIAADDSPAMLMSLAVKPLAMTPFPLYRLDETV